MHSPVKLAPAFKDYLWGGEKLADSYGKKSGGKIIAESWELSTHKDGLSAIAEGPFAGQTLKQYIEGLGAGVLGNQAAGREAELPILIKLIDARQALSIQVHPGDDYAERWEGEYGKTEMWLVLESEPGAFLYCGVNRALSREEAERMVEGGEIEGALRRVPVNKGDVFFIPPGTIHAIGKGILICEIQQCSNVTYRLYDFGRTDAAGKERPLHLRKALDVAVLTPQALNTAPELVIYDSQAAEVSLLRACGYFKTYRYQIRDGQAGFRTSQESFAALVCIDGEGELVSEAGALPIKKGESVFCPAQEAAYTVKGSCAFLLVTL